MSPERHSAPVDAGAVWEDFHDRLLGFIVRRVRDRDSAEDILQKVMLRIHGHAGELERAPAVGAWMHHARNAIADHYCPSRCLNRAARASSRAPEGVAP